MSAELRRKLVIVGDGACGKTCLLMYAALPDLSFACFIYYVLRQLLLAKAKLAFYRP